MHKKLLVVWVRDMGHEGRAGVKDEDDQVDVRCFLKERQSSTELARRTLVEVIRDVMRRVRLMWYEYM